MDAIEKLYDTHRKSLDVLTPKDSLWERIEERLDDEFIDDLSSEKMEWDSLEAPLFDALSHQLDEELPKNKEVVMKVEKSTPVRHLESKHKRQVRIWQYVAAAAVLLLLFVNVWPSLKSAQPGVISQEELLSQTNKQLEFIESEYTHKIKVQHQKIKAYDLQKLGLEEEFEDSYNRLTLDYKTLKVEYVESNYNDNVRTALIENLEMQMRLLKEQLSVLKSVESMQNTSTASKTL